MLEYIKHHQEIATNYLVQQYKESCNIHKIVETFIGRIQELEDQAHSIHMNKWLETATENSLDNIGSIVGEPRGAREDDEKYRIAILARIMTNRGGGTPEDLINAIKLAYKPHIIQYKETEPVSFSVFLHLPSYPKYIRDLIQKILPLGIKEYELTYSEGEQPFVLDESTSEGVPFLESNTLAREGLYYEYSDNRDDSRLEIEAGRIHKLAEKLGFAEIIGKTTSSIDGPTNVNPVNYLNVLPHDVNTLGGLKIQQGNKLSEVIQNGR